MIRLTVFLLSICLSICSISSIAQTHVVLQTNNVYDAQAFYADDQEHGYQDWDDNAIKFSRVAYYLAELELSDGNSTEELTDTYVLVKSDITDYYLGTTGLGSISSVKFGLGVDEPHNHLDPATYPPDHPLGHHVPDMHWGWSAGYKFVVLEGFADNNSDGTPNALFQFHCLEDAQYQDSIHVATTSQLSNDTLYIKINVNHKGWIKNVNVPDAGVLHGSYPETNRILSNSTDSPVFGPYAPVGIDEKADHSYSVVDYRRPWAPTIRFSFAGVNHVDLAIMDMSGRIVESQNDLRPQGETAVWSEPATGVYLYSFSSEGKVLVTEKFTVTR